jgi:hypothetical protein
MAFIPHGHPEREENFRQWFGKSKLVDKGGNPLVLYHGTDKDFSAFDPEKHGLSDHGYFGIGHYLSANPEVASVYSAYRGSMKAMDGDEVHEGANVLPVHVRLENPYVWPEGRRVAQSLDEAKKLTEELIRMGHDGVIVSNPYEEPQYASHHEVVVFHPEQIKSATGNRGTFDPNDPDITKAQGGATKLRATSLREPQLWATAQRIKAGEDAREEHAAMVNRVKPVKPYAEPVAPASPEQMADALQSTDPRKVPFLHAPRGLEEGTPVAVRLDIPAYEKKNAWIVSVHEPKPDFTAGKVIGYDSVAHITDPQFGVHEGAALNIASGKGKATIATVKGNWKPTTPEDAYAYAQQIHNDPEWRQVGMDPERHSYFYDRETQQPVVAAEEALHIGPLVYAKNPTYDAPENYKFAQGGEVEDDGITAYHGSPHDFDRFDLSKIGTGEGAQAYGHGLYFAEAEPVAKDYRDRLSGGLKRFVGDQPYQTQNPVHLAASLRKTFAPHGGDDRIIEVLQKDLEDINLDEQSRETYEKTIQIIKNREETPELVSKPTGHMYEVRINAHPDHFLDWDKPLSEQSKYVRSILANHTPLQRNRPYTDADLGKDLYYKNTQGMGGGPTATEELRNLGIKGIKYLDAQSRGAGEGSRNYVVFDDKLVNVKRKYAAGGVVEDDDEWHPDTWYHGTPDAREIYKSGFMTPRERASGSDKDAVYFFAKNPSVAKTYADPQRAWDYQGAEPEVMPVRLRMSNPKTIDWGGKRFRGRERDESGFDIHDHINKAREDGHDAVIITNVIDDYAAKGKPSTIAAVFDASRVRHQKAAFDPAQKDSRNIMAAKGGVV